MRVLAALVGGLAAGRVAWLGLRPVFALALFQRANFRGTVIPVAAGLVVAVAALAVESVWMAAGAWGGAPFDDRAAAAVVLVAVGLGLLGLFDDLAGTAADRGFRGHLRALRQGRLTTGGLKLVGGGAVALAAAALLARGDGPQLLVDAAVVALAANLGNLLDRAPGRALKAAALSLAGLAAASRAAGALAPTAVAVGAGLALLPDDLAERLMLGDAGANPLGGALGVGAVAVCSTGTRVGLLAALLALNLASELVSFSRVIDAVGPLRALDRAGRRP